tara:strand:- start:208 stop:642 length:435 start_codon:yes stop_codon:yes gene_type:complete
MIRYWSYWNFTWFLLAKYNMIEYSNLLKCSIVFTSCIGGYIVYIYPRRLRITYLSYNILPPYYVMVIGDLIIHQYPLYYSLTNNVIDNKICGGLVTLPLGGWVLTNYLLKSDFDKLYGINFKNLTLSCLGIIGAMGIYKHLIKN